MKTKKTLYYSTGLIVAIIILVNLLSDRFSLRLDLTEDNRYTLSDATRDILDRLDEPITVMAYFSEDLPPDIARARRDFKELLVEYNRLSRGQVAFEFNNPNLDEKSEQEAMGKGIQPVIINTREKDQAVQKRAYLGAVIQKGEQADILPFIQPGAAMEYALSSSIKKLSVLNKPVIGFLQGHGEPPLEAYSQVLSALNVLYRPEPVTLSDSTSLSEKYETIVIVAPADTLPPAHIEQLNAFVEAGNNLVMAIDRVVGDLNNAMGMAKITGLEEWLELQGIRIEPNFIVDENCAPITVTQQQGMFTISTNVNFPYIPIFSNFSNHPITTGLEAVLMQFPSSITYTGDSTNRFIPLIMSSKKSGTRAAPTYFDIQKKWNDTDFPLGNLVAGAILIGERKGKLVVFSDGDFPVNGVGQQARQIQPDNASLLVNAIDWLSDDTGLIELRTRGITARPLNQIEDGKKVFLKYLNFLLPILLIILYGFLRIQRNRSVKIRRMEERYV